MIKEKLIFSGHETFHCKNLWLKKGYDFVSNGGKFTDEACIELGVGRNMVNSIRYWLRAFNIIDPESESITDIAKFLFNDFDGKDKYLEDEATSWLMHFYLVSTGYASIFPIIFNDLRKLRPEFDESNLANMVAERGINVNKNSLKKDFSVFTRTYLAKNGNDKEDSFSGILADLDLVHIVTVDNSKKFIIQNGKQNQIPIELVLFLILENDEYGNSISFQSLYNSFNSIGNIFAFSREALENILEEMSNKFEYINYSNNAGIKELQFKYKPESFDILNSYYERN